MKKNIFVGIGVIVVLVVVIIGTSLILSQTSQQKINGVALQASSTPLINYTFPTNLDSLDIIPKFSEISANTQNSYNLKDINKAYGISLSTTQQDYLNKNKFILIPVSDTNINLYPSFDEMETTFENFGGSGDPQYRDPSNAKLITPDIALHAYHKYFDNALKALESRDLTLNLEQFLTSLYENITTDSKNVSGNTKDHYNLLTAQIAVARTLLENKSAAKPNYFKTPEEEQFYVDSDSSIDSLANAKKIITPYLNGLPASLVDKANQELKLIYSASNVVNSPLYGDYNKMIPSDYTQYTPRSHYTESSTLRAYFRTMMYLGRNTYFFQNDDGIIDANLLGYEVSRPTTEGVTPYNPWKKNMDLTGFFAGESDDITFTEWNSFVSTFSQGLNPANGVDQKIISNEVDHLGDLRKPKILSDVFIDPNIANVTKNDMLRSTLGLRIFGQRFTLDGWVLNSLTAGAEKTDVKLPSTPSSLFVSAALGNAKAKDYSDTFLQDSANFSSSEIVGFNTSLADVQQKIKTLTIPEWYDSISSSWLYVLTSFSQTFSNGYPLYMQSTPFQDKNIQTALGSFTELKHDTLLYAKQSYAEKGGGGDDGVLPPVVRGFVEPNLIFWHKFQTLVDYTYTLFEQKNILADTDALPMLSEFRDGVKFATNIAEKELSGKIITDDEYEQLRNLNFSYMTVPIVGGGVDPTIDSAKSALVADIHTDALLGQILYEATGRPYIMIALVGDNQQPRAVIGLTYNHYEFTAPLGGNRITDENWKSTVYDKSNSLPSKNFWYDSLLVK